MPPSRALNARLAKKSTAWETARPESATMPKTRAPETAIGENAPACAPQMTIMPIISGLIRYLKAKFMPIGTSSATAAGVKVPSAVSTAATANSTQGTRIARPRTRRIPWSTSRSIVPLSFATENR